MNYLFWALIMGVIVIAGVDSYGANIVKKSAKVVGMDQPIKIINEQYAKINSKIATYNKVVRDVYDESSEGAVLIVYYDDKNLKKIVGSYFGESGKSNVEYYFGDGNFFFVFSRQFLYKKPLSMDHSGRIKNTEVDRYYFSNGELIKWISGKQVILPSSAEFVQRNRMYKDVLEKYKRMFADPARVPIHTK